MILPNQPIVDISWLSENFGNPLLKIIESKLKPIGATHDWESGCRPGIAPRSPGYEPRMVTRPPTCYLLKLVEARGVEPLSETTFKLGCIHAYFSILR